MEQASGIVFIVAHANGCHFRLPGGETIDVSASDILNLKLTKHPFVVLRICNGIDEGLQPPLCARVREGCGRIAV